MAWTACRPGADKTPSPSSPARGIAHADAHGGHGVAILDACSIPQGDTVASQAGDIMLAMRLFVLAFAGGIWFLQQQVRLPGAESLLGLGLAAVLALSLGVMGRESAPGVRRFLARGWLLAGAAGLGFVWAAGFAHWRMADELPQALEGQDIEVSGVVAGLPQELERGLRFTFDVEQALPGVPQRISLAWYRGRDQDADESLMVPARAGERWRFTVRLKRPHGNMNPHGFDHEAWLFERGIRATGYVRPRAPAERLDARVWRPDHAVEMLREAIRDRFRTALPEAPYAGILIALAIRMPA